MGYRFSPIADKRTFQLALDYIAVRAGRLSEQVLGEPRPIDTLTLFAHSEKEFEYLASLVREYGPDSKLSHGATLYVDSDFTVAGQRIKILGVRKPERTRVEVGYADYPVTDYDAIKAAGHQGVMEISSGRGRRLLEVTLPDFDIRGYVVDEQDHLG